MYNSLDALATNGIISFDADAFIKGTPPRYVGNPSDTLYLPNEAPLMPLNQYGIAPGQYLPGQPSNDAFKDNSKHHNFTLPNILLGSVLLGAGYVLGKITKLGGIFKKDGAINKFFTSAKEKASSLIGKTESTITGDVAENAAEQTKSFITRAKEWFSALPKGVKTGAKITAGLGILYGIYNLMSPKHESNAQFGPAPQHYAYAQNKSEH